jgi:CheY-like chemotaxis protein
MFEFGPSQDLPTVMLVDDDPVSREVLATVLTMGGYTVHTTASGEALLELLDGGKYAPGVILLDARMPGLSGTRLIEELRARCAARVVVISASKAPDEVIAAADGFLFKPFGAEALQTLLEGHEPAMGNRPSSRPQAALDPAAPVVRADTLAQLREMMTEPAVKQIYSTIVTDLDKRLVLLEDAFAKRDDAEIRRIGHAIKGGCGMAGAQQAAQLGALLESTGNHLDNSATIVADLRAAAYNLKSMLEAEFAA